MFNYYSPACSIEYSTCICTCTALVFHPHYIILCLSYTLSHDVIVTLITSEEVQFLQWQIRCEKYGQMIKCIINNNNDDGAHEKKRRATPTQIIKFVIGCCIIDAVTKNRSLEDETALYLPTFVPCTFLLIAVLFFLFNICRMCSSRRWRRWYHFVQLLMDITD